jgi:hypothetical protein
MQHPPTEHRISDSEPPVRRGSGVARHRAPAVRDWRLTRANLRRAARGGTGLAAAVLGCLALATMAGQAGESAPLTGASVQMAAAGTEVGELGALRTFNRVPGAAETPVLEGVLADPGQTEEERAAAEAAAAQAAWLAANPTPVAGLDQIQMNNALKIVQAGQAMGLPKRAFVIAVATSLQESQLRNLASTRIPESYNYNAEGDGSDHDSVGLFQQRASTGWGAVSQLMDPSYAATAFYSALVRVPGWDTLPLTVAAQRVQVSAYPNHYAKHEARAQQIVDALVPAAP